MFKFIEKSEKVPYPADFPPREFYRPYQKVQAAVLNVFKELITIEGEREVDNYLSLHPELLMSILSARSVKHNGGYWFINKQAIKSSFGENRGLIPDFILGSHNSEGFKWILVELKSPQVKLYNTSAHKRPLFSNDMNEGINQLLEYIDCTERMQGMYRDEFKLENLRKPYGMLIIGKENELVNNEDKKKLKSSLNSLTQNYLEIHTYDWLIRGLDLVENENDLIIDNPYLD